jgi:hypothetical protein
MYGPPLDRQTIKLRGFWSARKLYRLSDRHLAEHTRISASFGGYMGVVSSARLFPTAVNLSFLDRSRCFFFQVAAQLSSRG